MASLEYPKRQNRRIPKKEEDKLEHEDVETSINGSSYEFINVNIAEDDGHENSTSQSSSTLKENLANWFISENIPHNAGNKLLTILREEGIDVPSSVQALIEAYKTDNNKVFAELKDLKKIVSLMKTDLDRQSAAVAELNLKFNLMSEKLCGVPVAEEFNFPINTAEELTNFDKRLKLEPDFEKHVKLLLATKMKGKVSLNFSEIIADNLLAEINWNGRKKMRPISNLKFFQTTLYGCLNRFYSSFEDYEKDVKDAIKKGKNRIDQRKHKFRLQNKLVT